MGMTAVIAMGAGAGMSAGGAYASGKAQKKLAEYNAQVADIQAEDAIARGRQEESRHRTDVRVLTGSQRAAWGASGADVNSGNAVDVQADTARMGELDALTIRANAAREAWGYKVQAQDMRARGTIAQREGTTKAIGTIVSSAGSYASNRWGFGGTSKG